MTLDTLYHIVAYGGGGIVVLMTIIQVTPIKVNPWSWLARTIGRAINREVIDKVDALSKDVKENKEADDEQWASLSRSHILRFGDELRHGMSHSKEHFDQILIDITKYEQYCKDHPRYLNDIANATIKHIKKTYQECLDEDNFL